MTQRCGRTGEKNTPRRPKNNSSGLHRLGAMAAEGAGEHRAERREQRACLGTALTMTSWAVCNGQFAMGSLH